MLLPLLEGSDMFLTNIRIKPTNNVKVFLESDSGMNIAKCAGVNRKLYAALEASAMFPDGDFSLEVSSPGIGEPLTQLRQYVKNIGRTITVEPTEGPEVSGVLKEVTEDKILLEITTGKKKEISEVTLPFSFIKKAVVEVRFK